MADEKDKAADGEAAASKRAKLVKGRVLTPHPIDGAIVPADTVLKLEKAQADALVAAGVLDVHPDAVKYAEETAAAAAAAAAAEAAALE